MSIVRHVVNGLALVGILLLAGVIAHTAPTDDSWADPVRVDGQVGSTVSGRNLTVTVHEVRATDSVETPGGWVGTTPGAWIVVDVTAQTIVTDFGALFGTVQLVVDGVTYSASERPDTDTIAETSLSTGIPLRGPVLFEVPKSVLDAGSAELRFAVNSDPRADSLLIIPIRIDRLDYSPTLETAPVTP